MLIPISNSARDYAWGSETLIAELQGREPSGTPEAEIWFGDHPGSPSRVDDGTGRPLDRALAEVGVPPLPYLLKLLAAGMSLSIQAHPSRDQAAEGFAREERAGVPRDAVERLYKDENHKPEIIVALSERFRALVGLRPLAATRRLLASLPERPGVRALVAALEPVDGEDDAAVLHRVMGWVLSGEATEVVDDLAAALAASGPDVDHEASEFAAERDVLRRIADQFPADAGLVVATLMNLVELARGEALFAPAGVLHAYQDGLGVELMAASDNVLRGGLTPKHIDVPELMRVVDTSTGAAPIVEPDEIAPGVFSYDAGVPDFQLVRVEATFEAVAEIPLTGTAIVLATSGDVVIEAGDDRVELVPGTAAVVIGASVAIGGAGEAFVAQPGRP
ncbi:mannose-6-phosphate isomerase, class I [Microbacterium imperiale]|uniref:mannose-6-phosphate isomerase n=1 Tax=Microbacterium imperiale TaxID=33884 RepID=A0A9W6HDR1_9MICO|nr:mannose-6-phosphate isomerase, class I [Microbacterium imperiale]MBP2420226.1 mannose-6-phosphate isomerase [Microbacterium imperiale]MDS0197911.1 mannose-6-phosphate isomerase, class I [Microbacterium imperiale]BFE40568.1 mannose-6-phosphate isomerase, class I [Microbacterium imperiale]GLJ78457.1 mannose-6-phosphate isomerase, class I [Microbacterium imperiale]